jgi:hypothetical protein
MERIPSFDAGQRGRGERADRGDQEARPKMAAVFERDAPAPRRLFVNRRRNPAPELDVAAQVKLVGDVIAVAQRFQLAGKMLGPFPFLQQLPGEGIAVGIAFGIKAGAGIPVPVPGAADIGAGLQHPHPHPQFAQAIQLVHTRQARANDDGVVILCGRGCRRGSSHLVLIPGFVLRRSYPVRLPGTNVVEAWRLQFSVCLAKVTAQFR